MSSKRARLVEEAEAGPANGSSASNNTADGASQAATHGPGGAQAGAASAAAAGGDGGAAVARGGAGGNGAAVATGGAGGGAGTAAPPVGQPGAVMLDGYERIGISPVQRPANIVKQEVESDTRQTRDEGAVRRVVAFVGLDSTDDALCGRLKRDSTTLGRLLPRVGVPFAVSVVLDAASEIPARQPALACLLGLVSVGFPTISTSVASGVNERLGDALVAGNLTRAKLLLRFVGELADARVVTTATFVAQLSTFLGAAEEVTTSPTVADTYAFLVAQALLWCGRHVHDSDSDGLERLFERLQIFMVARDGEAARREEAAGRELDDDVDEAGRGGDAKERRHIVPPPLAQFNDKVAPKTPLEAPDLLSEAWAAVCALRAASWALSYSTRVSGLLSDDLAVVAPVTTEAVAPLMDAGGLAGALMARSPLRIFGAGGLSGEKGLKPAQLDKVSTYDLFAARDVAWDVLVTFQPLHFTAANELLAAPCAFPPAALLVETIMMQMLALPASPANITYYAAVLLDLCELEESIGAAIGLCATIISNHLLELDVEVGERLASWLALHVSHLGFKWIWERWAKVVDLPRHHPRRRFVRFALDKVFTLGFYDRVRETVPDALMELIPVRPRTSSMYYDTASFEGADDRTPPKDELAIAESLQKRVVGKEPAEALGDWLSAEVPDLKTRARLLMHAILTRGSKSYTHVTVLLTRYRDVVDTICAEALEDDTEVEVEILHAVEDVWGTQTHTIGVLVGKLLEFEVVTGAHVATWALRTREDGPKSRADDRPWATFLFDAVVAAVEHGITRRDSLQLVVETDPGDADARERLDEVNSAIGETIVTAFSTLAREAQAVEARRTARREAGRGTDEADTHWLHLLTSRMTWLGRRFRGLLERVIDDAATAVSVAPDEFVAAFEAVRATPEVDGKVTSVLRRDTIRG